MAPLTSEQLLREQQSRDPSSVTSLKLSLRALSNVSCLVGFRCLERLDLSCNSIRTLEGLGCCGNLKWLSVAQNKIESLKGVEGLSKLTVLNAGQNMIQSISEVTSLINLRALILNDNKISTIYKLESLTYLNTLVLSRNPIIDIGKSLGNMKSLTKISFSNCNIQDIGSSLISCEELKEARFANNDISTIPNQIIQNSKLQLLDLGKNGISRWSDLKVLSELHNLRNLNLQGNPIAEKDEIVKKVRKIVPKLQIFNSKPIEKFSGTTKPLAEEDALTPDSKCRSSHDGDSCLTHKGEKRKKGKRDSACENSLPDDDPKKKKIQKGLYVPDKATGNGHSPFDYAEARITEKQKPNKSKGMRSVESALGTGSIEKEELRDGVKEIKDEGMAMELRTTKSLEFDDGDASFMEIVFSEKEGEIRMHKTERPAEDKLLGGLVIDHEKEKKKKKNKKASVVSGRLALRHLPHILDIGAGGPSTWDD